MTKKHNIILQPSGRRGQIDAGTSVRTAARELGVEIESICAENATCGKCRVKIETGRFDRLGITSAPDHASPIGPSETAYLDARLEAWGPFGRGWSFERASAHVVAPVAFL